MLRAILAFFCCWSMLAQSLPAPQPGTGPRRLSYLNAPNSLPARGLVGYWDARKQWNRLLASDDFSQAAWSKYSGATVTGSNTLNPSSGYLQQDVTVGVDGVFTFSVVLSASTAASTTIVIADGSDGDPQITKTVSLTTQPTRFDVGGSMALSGVKVVAVLIFAHSSATITLGGAQLNSGPLPLPYQRTTDGKWTNLASPGTGDGTLTNGPTWQVGDVGRRNLLYKTSAMDDGATWSVNSGAVVSGITDYRGGNTAFRMTATNVNANTRQTVVSLPAGTYSLSAWMRTTASLVTLYLKEETGSVFHTINVPGTGVWTRVSGAFSVGAGNLTFIIYNNDGQVGDVVEYCEPQMELSAQPTPYQPVGASWPYQGVTGLSFDGTNDFVMGTINLGAPAATACVLLTPTSMTGADEILRIGDIFDVLEMFSIGTSVYIRGPSITTVQADNVLAIGVPSLICATWSGTTATIYKDGLYVTSGIVAALPSPASKTYLIGAYADGSNAFAGSLVGLPLWNRALSPDEVMQATRALKGW